MDLIIWRHAEAEDKPEEGGRAIDDLERALTSRGEKQAARMAAWLDRQLPDGVKVLCSPALRTEQTVLALGRKYKLRPELMPERTAEDLLELVDWPKAKTPVLVVGHQPALGQAVSRLLGLAESECPIKKGAVWWLRSRERDGATQAIVLSVQSPELV